MNILITIRMWLDSLDAEEFKKYLSIFLAGFLLITAAVMYRYYRNISSEKRKIATLNVSRKKLKDIFERYELVKKQQQDVDSLLAQDKDFKIQEYFDNLLKKQNLEKSKTQPTEPVPEDVLAGYTQWKLYANLSNLNMKQLSELLYEIEKTPRVYTQDLEIEKGKQGKTITAKITIATLEPKVAESSKE